jgi:hypothetical protein
MPDRTMDNTPSWPVLAQPDTGSATPSVDEPDAGLLKRPPQG